MSTLRIYNVSDYIHAGAAPRAQGSLSQGPKYYAGVRELPNGSWKSSYLPTGGVSFALNPIFERLAEQDPDETLVFCIDDAPTVKREMYRQLLKDEKGYKSSRPKKSPEISVQRNMIKDVLSLVSSNVLFSPGLEADDIIAELVRQYKSSYDHIYIHTRDADLFCLVTDNVSIGLVGDRGKEVTKSNFFNVCKDKNKYGIPFNGILLDKLFHGDASDSIPKISGIMQDKIRAYITPDKYHLLTNLSLLKTWVGLATNYDEYTMGVLELLLPLRVPEEDIQLYDEPININNLYYLGSKVGNKYTNSSKSKLLQEEDTRITDVLNHYTDVFHMEGGHYGG